MSISEKLTQQKLLEILVKAYTEGQENKNIQLHDLLEDMRQHVLTIINSKQ